MMSCDFVQSALGYITAADTLLHCIQERELNQVQKELYKRQILSYIFKVYHLYWKAKEETEDKSDDSSHYVVSGLKSIDYIAVETQRTIRLARRTIKALSLRHRLVLCDFPVGYRIWLARVMILILWKKER